MQFSKLSSYRYPVMGRGGCARSADYCTRWGGAVVRWCSTQGPREALGGPTGSTAASLGVAPSPPGHSRDEDGKAGMGSSFDAQNKAERTKYRRQQRTSRTRKPHHSFRRGYPATHEASGSEAVAVPRSIDIGAVEDLVDVEKFFPHAVAHLKATPASQEAADDSAARRWHETTHDFNVDGIVTPLKKAAKERRESGTASFFDEGSLDVRGGMAQKLQSGMYSSAREPVDRDSPDLLSLTGGDARRHGALRTATESNASPADQTIEGDRGDTGAYREFGDTPVQLTDMLRERLMELKADKLREERNETFLPQRLRHSASDELLALAQRGEANVVSSPPLGAYSPASPHLRRSPSSSRETLRKRAGTSATTLADLNQSEDQTMGDQTASDESVLINSGKPILRDGVTPAQLAQAMQTVLDADDAVPGASLHDPLRRLASIAARAGRHSMPFGDDVVNESGSATEAAGVEGPGVVHLLRTLPRAGFCSRREAASIIASGQVRVNNVVERNPFRLLRAEDDVHVAGHQSRLRFAPPRLWMYHKPAHVIVSRNDVAGRTLISKHARILGMDHLIPVGSLPMRAHGLLLLTNDGELSRFLENPKSMVQRTYLLRVRPSLDPLLVHKLNSEGVHINGRRYHNAEFFVNPATKSRYSLKVKVRGESMPIAHLMQHLGRKVERGGRISFGPFSLTNLAVGSVREVTVPPFYTEHLGSNWQPFVERDWPYFRRQRVARLRRLCRYRELTPKELEELDNYTYEEVKGALSFESSELQTVAERRAAQLRAAQRLDDGQLPLPEDFPSGYSRRPTRRGDVVVEDTIDAPPYQDDSDTIVEDITLLG